MVSILDLGKIERLIPKKAKEAILKKIKGKYFVFDKESLTEFEQFDDGLHEIVIIDGYLARRQKGRGGVITFFHRWLMQREVENFAEEKDTTEDKIEVHHTTFCKKINIKSCLEPITKTEHQKRHRGYFGIDYLIKEEF